MSEPTKPRASTVIRQTAKRLRTLALMLGNKEDGAMLRDAEALEQAARDYDEAIAALEGLMTESHLYKNTNCSACNAARAVLAKAAT